MLTKYQKPLTALLLVGFLAGLMSIGPSTLFAEYYRGVDVTAVTYPPAYGYLWVRIDNKGSEARNFTPWAYRTGSGWTALTPTKTIQPGSYATWTSSNQYTWEATVVNAVMNVSEPYANPQTECATVSFMSRVGSGQYYGKTNQTECSYVDMSKFWSEPAQGAWKKTRFYGYNHDSDSCCWIEQAEAWWLRYNGGLMCQNCPECTAHDVPMIAYYRGNPTGKLYVSPSPMGVTCGWDEETQQCRAPTAGADVALNNDFFKWSPSDGLAQRQHNPESTNWGYSEDIDVVMDEICLDLDGEHDRRMDSTDRIYINYQGLTTDTHGMLLSIATMPISMTLQSGARQYGGGLFSGNFCTTDEASSWIWAWKYGGEYLGYVMYDIPDKGVHYLAKTYRLDYWEQGQDFTGSYVFEHWYLAEGYGIVRVATKSFDAQGNVGYDVDMTAFEFTNGTASCP